MQHSDFRHIQATLPTLHTDNRALQPDFFLYHISPGGVVTHPLRTREFGIFLCLEGEARGRIDARPFHQSASTLMVYQPGQVLELCSASPQFSGIGMVMTPNFVQQLELPPDIRLTHHMSQHPLFPLHRHQVDSMHHYWRMLRRLLSEERPYQRETLRHLVLAFFYGFGTYLFEREQEKERATSREELLCEAFVHSVQTHFRSQRRVSFYASQLHISPSHLAAVVGRVTGRQPAQWIDAILETEARILLRDSSLTIQQIAFELGFPSQSFFGKFFRRLTGLSPRAYRATLTTPNPEACNP